MGTRTGSGDGYGQQAFFFVGGRYLGTDAKEPSATVKVVSQSDTEVTLAYPLYRKGDPLCCPGGGQASVRFAAEQRQAAGARHDPAGELQQRPRAQLIRASPPGGCRFAHPARRAAAARCARFLSWCGNERHREERTWSDEREDRRQRRRRLLKGKNFAHVATLRADGSVQTAPVWVDVQDGRPVVNSAEGRAWPRNLERDPRVTLTVQNMENPYEYVEVRGHVAERTHDGADEHIDALAKKYLDKDSYPLAPAGRTAPDHPHRPRARARVGRLRLTSCRSSRRHSDGRARLRAQPLLPQQQLAGRARLEHALRVRVPTTRACHLRARSAYARSERADDDHKSDSDTSPACDWPRGAPSTMGRAEAWASLHCRAARSATIAATSRWASASPSRGPGASAAPAPRARERSTAAGCVPGEPPLDGLQRMALGQVDIAIELLEGDAARCARGEGACTRRARRSSACARWCGCSSASSARTPTRARTPPLRDVGRLLSGARDARGDARHARRPDRAPPAQARRAAGVRRLRRALLAERERVERGRWARAKRSPQALAQLHDLRDRVLAWRPSGHDPAQRVPDCDAAKLVDPACATCTRRGASAMRRARASNGERRARDARVAQTRQGPALRRRNARAQTREAQAAPRRGRAPAPPGATAPTSSANCSARSTTWRCSPSACAPRPSRGGVAARRPSESGARTRKLLLKLIERRRRKLRRRALRDGERLYRRSPKKFVRRLRR